MKWWCTISAQVVVSASVGARGSRRSEARWLGALWLSRPGTTVLVSCYLSSGIDLLCWSKVRSPHGSDYSKSVRWKIIYKRITS